MSDRRATFSTKKYTDAITTRFSKTISDNQEVKFNTRNSNVSSNNFTLTAGASDLYFALILPEMSAGHDFSNEPLHFIQAGTALAFVNVDCVGIKFRNSNVEYFVQGTTVSN